MAATKNTPAQALAERTSDAYSFDRYGFTAWTACVRMLQKHGLTEREVEAVLRSKWTRWAADASDKPYGRATSKDLERFMNTARGCSWADVRKLTAETFAGE